MVAGQPLEVQRGAEVRGQVVGPVHATGDGVERRGHGDIGRCRPVGAVGEHADHHRALQRWQLRGDGRDAIQTAELLAPVAVAIGRHQHGGLCLPEAIHHAVDPEVAGGGGERGPDGIRGQERDDGLGDVRHVGGHPIAGLHAVGGEGRRQCSYLFAQLLPRVGAPIAVLGDGHECLVARAVSVRKRVLRVRQRGLREESTLAHGTVARVEHDWAGVADDLAVRPHSLPELLGVLHRPTVQGNRVDDIGPISGDRATELVDARGGDALGSRRPQRLHEGFPSKCRSFGKRWHPTIDTASRSSAA